MFWAATALRGVTSPEGYCGFSQFFMTAAEHTFYYEEGVGFLF